MRLHPMGFTRKDGGRVTLRSLSPADAGAYRRHLSRTRRETDYLLPMATERAPSPARLRQHLQEALGAPDAAILGAFLDGHLAAVGTLSPYGRMQRVGHRCTLSVSVLARCWGRGLGSLLVARILDLAEAAGYRQAELNVDAENQRAIRLYQSFGFRRAGQVENALLHRDGRYGSEDTMILPLRDRKL